jgi:spore germination protein GerM
VGRRCSAPSVRCRLPHPLHGAIQAVLAGAHGGRDYSEVPAGSRLSDLSLRGAVAYADFQPRHLRPRWLAWFGGQAVFMLTQFTRVHAVQFLVDGRIQAMSGNEGYPIGHPRTRQDFPYMTG